MATTSAIVSQIRSALAISDPELDTSIGTPTRKIIDAVSESIGQAYVDSHLLDYQYDIDAKSGDDLTQFVQLFGFTRFSPKRATGTVTFSRPTPDTTVISIPFGTQIASANGIPVIFATVVPAVLASGATSVDVPIMSVDGGKAANLAVGSITVRSSPIVGVTVTNNIATSGGTDVETDIELRARFRATVFRSLAGTQGMYEGIALEDAGVTRVNVLGATKNNLEQVQVSGGIAISGVPDARFVFSNSSVVGTDIAAGSILTPGVHYSFDTTTDPAHPRIVVLNASAIPDGTILDMSFDYVSTVSRNDPTLSPPITNRIDVYTDGTRAVQATETLVFHSSNTFNTTPASKFYLFNYITDHWDHPASGDYFVPLAFVPIVTVPSSITINGVTYIQNATTGNSFKVYYDASAFGGSPVSLAGLGFKAANAPVNNSVFTLSYSYNEIPRSVSDAIAGWRILGTDVKVHQAVFVPLRFNFAVMYTAHANQTAVNLAIDAALASYASQLSFGSVVQVSDILQTVHNVIGVDNVKFLTTTDDAVNNGIQHVDSSGNVITNFGVADVHYLDNQIVLYDSSRIVVKAQNTF